MLIFSSVSPSDSGQGEDERTQAHSGGLLRYFHKKRRDEDGPPPSSSSNSNSNPNPNSTSSSNSNSSSSVQTTNDIDQIADCSFLVGLSDDTNPKCRRTMEDAYTYIYNFANIKDAGFFGVYDGHAGRLTAEWCAKNLHTYVERQIQSHGSPDLCRALNSAFLEADRQIGQLGLHNSGSTAAVAVLADETFTSRSDDKDTAKDKRPTKKLYVANVGDTRVILSRSGQPLRLTYDHKGSDDHESQRISNAGGLMINHRVNGVLAVTRSLGDTVMKDLVTGAPYTTETELSEDDEFFIVACDGLWDVCDDQTAVTLVRSIADPVRASRVLVDYALSHFSTDNLTCMVVRLSGE